MSERSPMPSPTTVPSKRATSAIVFVLPPSTPSSRSLIDLAPLGGEQTLRQVRPVCCSERGVEPVGQIDVEDEWVCAERTYRVLTATAPGGLGRERLVLPEHLDETAHVPRQRAARENLDAGSRAATFDLDDQVVREPGQHAVRVRHVDRMDLVLVVEDRIHDVDRQLELVDAASG